MARKKRDKKADNKPSFFEHISKETAGNIYAIASIVAAICLALAAVGQGGMVGGFVFDLLSRLFGIGYYLLPLVFLVIAVSFFQVREERDLRVPQMIGSILFFFAALGLINLTFAGQGGMVGNVLSKALVSLFDLYASMIILVALIIVSALIIFDTSIKLDLLRLFKKGKRGDESENALAANESLALDRAVEENRNTDVDPVVAQAPVPKPARRDDEAFAPMIMRKSAKAWAPPPLSLLEKDRGKAGVGDIKANANLIKRTLLNFGIIVEMDEVSIGPSVTRYALKPAEGVKLSKILGLQNNLELALAAHPVRIEAPIPGKSLVGIEVPNTTKSTIGLGSLLSESGYTDSDKPLQVALGRDISGHSHFANLAKMPHMLVAGATGSGKSVTIHAIVSSLIYRNPPDNLKFVMVDPKRVELTLYNGIPHLLTPVITDPKKSILALKWLAKEMDRRYDILEKSSVRDIDSYHKNILIPSLKKGEEEDGADPMPYIVVIIDELADLMQSYPRELESAIVRLAQMSRAVGIHLVLSTQRPSVNVITGLIKANIPSRIALQVSSQIDSRTIIDMAGAEKLLGAGDMLYISGEMSKPTRIQSAFISEAEVKDVAKYLRDNYADELQTQINFTTENTSNSIFSASLEDEDGGGDDDEMYEEAREIVLQAGKASTSYLQRKLRIGYARAARLIDLLEERGVIGPGSGAKPREVIGATEQSEFGSTDEDEIA